MLGNSYAINYYKWRKIIFSLHVCSLKLSPPSRRNLPWFPLPRSSVKLQTTCTMWVIPHRKCGSLVQLLHPGPSAVSSLVGRHMKVIMNQSHKFLSTLPFICFHQSWLERLLVWHKFCWSIKLNQHTLYITLCSSRAELKWNILESFDSNTFLFQIPSEEARHD